MLDKYHFGNSPAAANLVSILIKNNNENHNASVSKLLAKYNHALNQLDVCGENMDEQARTFILKLIKKSFVETINASALPALVISHASNVFIKNWKMAILKDRKRNDFLKNWSKKK